ncbi:MAG: hypothetical protein KatS3mg068_0296 [Candidatus Sericytochromatia bacterium]|nr:MAG: hypothetical protein KatS3mg068_0296 [Candidatus Sericytochromatia bacterium]
MDNQLNSYNSASIFNAVYSYNTIGKMAAGNNVIMSASTPGLPQDTFRRNYSFTSQRFMKPVSEATKFIKDLGQAISSIGFISKIVSFFYPPAAAVSSITEIAGPVMVNLVGDTEPKPVVYNTTEKYNPWIR